jgi:hypothetical protein
MMLNVSTVVAKSRDLLGAAAANQSDLHDTDLNPPALMQMLAIIREDATRLSHILCYLDCDADIRSIDGFTLSKITQSCAGTVPSGPTMCAPIYDAQGRLLASLHLATSDTDGSQTLAKLLRALIESAAHAISERLFRMAYRDSWLSLELLASHAENIPKGALISVVLEVGGGTFDVKYWDVVRQTTCMPRELVKDAPPAEGVDVFIVGSDKGCMAFDIGR